MTVGSAFRSHRAVRYLTATCGALSLGLILASPGCGGSSGGGGSSPTDDTTSPELAGVWHLEGGNPSPHLLFALLADETYLLGFDGIEGQPGLERGEFALNEAEDTLQLNPAAGGESQSILVDALDVSSVMIEADGIRLAVEGDDDFLVEPIARDTDGIVGGWGVSYPSLDGQVVLSFIDEETYFFIKSDEEDDAIERGKYSWSAVNEAFDIDRVDVNTLESRGFSMATGPKEIDPDADEIAYRYINHGNDGIPLREICPDCSVAEVETRPNFGARAFDSPGQPSDPGDDDDNGAGGNGDADDPSDFDGDPTTNNLTATTTIFDTTKFLYTGPDSRQVGVDPEDMEARRVSVVRGRVIDTAGVPLDGVRVAVADHPEFGHTLTDADGDFDLAVNGGGTLTIDYQREGRLSAQRQVEVPWQRFVRAPDVALIGLDAESTAVNLQNDDMQMHRAAMSSDGDGERTNRLLVPPDTQTATITHADGTTEELDEITLRATEYTVGDRGPEAMPAELPPTSAYTYAVELSVDEAVNAGATRVDFDEPLVNYVDDFIGFGAGEAVPTAFYDREQGEWIPSDNGIVVEVVDVTGGMVELDVTGDGQADGGSALVEHGITEEERTVLVGEYEIGDVFWRVAVENFSAWDYNWPFAPPDDAEFPQLVADDFPPGFSPNVECEQPGSTIECFGQAVSKKVEIVGVESSLHYTSRRAAGRGQTIDIPVSGDSVPDSLEGIDLEINVAGQQHNFDFPPESNLSQEFTWDRKDAYGRDLQGEQTADIRVGYTYSGMYGNAADAASSFGQFPSNITGNRLREEVTLEQQIQKSIGNGWDARSQELAGWSLNLHHAYDVNAGTLYKGDGKQRGVQPDSVPVLVKRSDRENLSATGVATFPDGSIIASETDRDVVWHIAPDGDTQVFAGGGEDPGDGAPATDVQLSEPWGVDVARDGSVYIAEAGAHRIRKVEPDGGITTIAGTGEGGYDGDGGAATDAQLNLPLFVAVAEDGTVYVSDSANHRIRRIGLDGRITTVAGTGVEGFSGDKGPAVEAELNSPRGVAVARNGSVYFSDSFNDRVREISSSGVIRTVAGTGDKGYSGDGGAGIEANLNVPKGVDVAADGSVYFADGRVTVGDGRIRQVRPDGVITTVAGGGQESSGDPSAPRASPNAPAVGVVIPGLTDVAVDPAGGFIIPPTNISNPGGSGASPILAVETRDPELIDPDQIADPSSFSPFSVPSADGSEVYRFDAVGRHLETRHAFTGATLWSFSYDDAGRLVSLADADGRETMIERTPAGEPTAIIAPEGQVTDLSLDDAGYLVGIENPAGESHAFSYDDGLLVDHTDPRGGTSQYSYDDNGLLLTAVDPAGNEQSLTRSETSTGYSVERTSPEGRTTTYTLEAIPQGGMRRNIDFASGTEVTVTSTPDGVSVLENSGGTTVRTSQGPDPRFGMRAPFIRQLLVETPGGLEMRADVEREIDLDDPEDWLSLVEWQETVDRNGRVTTLDYDPGARTFTRKSPENRVLATTIDEAGRNVRHEVDGDPAAVAFSYDDQGRLDEVTYGDGPAARISSAAYDAQGRMASWTDPTGNTETYTYDDANRVQAINHPDGESLGLAYDANGNVSTVTPPGRPGHDFAHTSWGALTEYLMPEIAGQNAQTSFVYDGDRHAVTQTLPDGRAVDVAYDAAGLPSSVTLARDTTTYAYDPQGRLASATGANGPDIAYGYDGLLRTSLEWSGVVSGVVDRSFNDDFALASISVSGAGPRNRTYDDDGLLTAVDAMTLSRVGDTGLVSGSQIGNVTDSYNYNDFGELIAYEASHGDDTVFSVEYDRDERGRIVEATETIEAETTIRSYEYDERGRLIEVAEGSETTSYEYDRNGNRTSLEKNGIMTAATYDDRDRLSTYGSDTYSYRDSGHLVSRTEGTASTGYGYDELGNLIDVTLPDGTEIEYVQGPEYRRIGRKVDGELVQGFLYQDALNPVAQLDASGEVELEFVYASRAQVPDFMIKEGEIYRLVTDHLGSVRLVVQEATGEVAQRLDYGPFGAVTNDTNPGFQPFGFAGGLYDPATGLVRFGVRDYDAETGRWTAPDPIHFAGAQANLYVYASNDPVNLIDPTGKNPALIACGVFATAAVGLSMAGVPAKFDLGAELQDRDRTRAERLATADFGGQGAADDLDAVREQKQETQEAADRTSQSVEAAGASTRPESTVVEWVIGLF